MGRGLGTPGAIPQQSDRMEASCMLEGCGPTQLSVVGQVGPEQKTSPRGESSQKPLLQLSQHAQLPGKRVFETRVEKPEVLSLQMNFGN